MKRKFLEDLGLEKDVIDNIMAENGKDVEKAKGDYDDMKQQLDTATSTITELKAANTNNEALQTKVTEYETQIAQLRDQSDKALLEKEIDVILTGANVQSLKAAKALLDREKVKRGEDGVIIGVTEQVEVWKTENPWLIKTGATQTIYNPPGGGDSNTKGLAATLASQRNEVKQIQTQENPYANAWG